MKKPLAVLDTNVIISGLILPKSNPGKIMRLWKSKKFDLITSTPVLKELERVLSYPKISMKYSLTTTAIGDMLNKIKKNSKIISQLKLPRVSVRDKEDLIVIATAIDGK